MHFANIKQCHVFLSTDTCRVYLRSLLYVLKKKESKKKKTIFSPFIPYFASHSFKWRMIRTLLCTQRREMCRILRWLFSLTWLGEAIKTEQRQEKYRKSLSYVRSTNNEIPECRSLKQIAPLSIQRVRFYYFSFFNLTFKPDGIWEFAQRKIMYLMLS